MKRIIILPLAERDIKDTTDYYGEINVELKVQFVHALNASFVQLCLNPSAFHNVRKEIRKYVMKRFPFCIYFVDKPEAVFNLAVFHDKRNPKIWKTRMIRE